MKSKFLIILLTLIVTMMQAQRDTLDYNTTYDSDTATVEKIESDSVVVFTGVLNGIEYSSTYRINVEFILMDSLTAILDSIANLKQQQSYFVEEYYRMYQQTNSKLWNLQRQYARLEELYDALYNP